MESHPRLSHGSLDLKISLLDSSIGSRREFFISLRRERGELMRGSGRDFFPWVYWTAFLKVSSPPPSIGVRLGADVGNRGIGLDREVLFDLSPT